MNKNSLVYIISAMLILVSLGCEQEVDEREADELIRLEAYMRVHYSDIEPTESGLYCIVYDEGVNLHPQEDRYVLYDFTGRNLDGYVYETTSSDSADLYDIYSDRTRYAPKFQKFKVDDDVMIKGLAEGLAHISEGGKARLIMPSNLAYGTESYLALHPFSSVIIDVELLRVVQDTLTYELEQISDYVAENYPEVELNDILIDGVYFLEVTEDELDEDVPVREELEEGDIVKINYSGTLIDGWMFDTNIEEVARENNIYDSNKKYEPMEIMVGNTDFIRGFALVLKNMSTRTTAKVIIPSKYAYKHEGTSVIPPLSPLVFEISVLEKVEQDDETEE